jgi:release factor glutamine methyltransferase
MTVLEVLQASTDYFRKRQIESARLNAEHLLAYVLERKRIELYLEFDRTLTETELKPLRDLVRRRGEGEPLQHLLGTVEFCGQVFACDKRAMVPRPETEELVELVVAECNRSRTSAALLSSLKILDVGTGSGVIALTLAIKFPDAAIIGVDISEDALSLAKENAARLGLADRVQFRHGDLLDYFSERFDIIVANLPYIAMSDRPSLSREVQHDPDAALFGGEQGNEVIQRLIDRAPDRLVAGGLLALEIGETQAGPILEALTLKKYEDMAPKNDYSGRLRFVLARYG